MNMDRKISMVVPKGRMFERVAHLLQDSGIGLKTNHRCYIPLVDDAEIGAKIMKPQNIGQLVELGSHDVGFTGHDWIVETGARVVELMDTGFDPVRIVAAAPRKAPKPRPGGKRFIVASEYENIASRWLREAGYEFLLLRTFGATEAFPPGDADMIIDNSASGRTLEGHDLRILASIMSSSTRLIANPGAMADSRKKEKIEELVMLFQAVLHARDRVMLEMNTSRDKLDAIVALLPCMRSPTVSPLYREQGFAVKAAVPRSEIVDLVPRLKKMGATDILEYEFRKVIS